MEQLLEQNLRDVQLGSRTMFSLGSEEVTTGKWEKERNEVGGG